MLMQGLQILQGLLLPSVLFGRLHSPSQAPIIVDAPSSSSSRCCSGSNLQCTSSSSQSGQKR
jgi:hypothetical protein